MSQIKAFLIDSVAYILANRKLGYSLTQMSDEMARLRDTESSVKMITQPAPWDENAPMRGGRNVELARQTLKRSKDPRYIANPFYNLMKHNRANGHYLFDEIKKPDEISNSPNWAYLRKGTVITASSIEFELKENIKVIGSQDDADKVMADQSERYESN